MNSPPATKPKRPTMTSRPAHPKRPGSPKRRAVLIIVGVLALGLLAAPAALAAAGGGSAGFSGGGGGGGGGHGSGFAIYIIIDLLIHIALLGHGLGALVLIALALAYFFFTRMVPKMQATAAERNAKRAGGKRRTSSRERRVELAAAEAADEDPDFAPDAVRANATRLFLDIQHAWDADDRVRLRGLVGADLLAEWERRLDDFSRRGWHNHVEPIGKPVVEYVGLHRTGDPDTDRIVVRIDARIKDYVVDNYGRRIKRTGSLGEINHVREFWTLQRRAPGHWVLASIEQGAEGKHALDDQIVATAWGDEQSLRDQALIEGAVADAVPEGTQVAEVADLQFTGDAHSAANDLSLADGRFAPDVLEVAVRRAIDAWALAVDGNDALLAGVATPAARRELLYANDTSGHVRVVVRGPSIKRIRIVGLDAGAEPPTMTVEVDITGRRYLEDRDTAAVLAGSRSRSSSFTERWTFALTADQAQPWQITATGAPVGLA
jgi:predicted lipid-binding transport protein (Tim44 family)